MLHLTLCEQVAQLGVLEVEEVVEVLLNYVRVKNNSKKTLFLMKKMKWKM